MKKFVYGAIFGWTWAVANTALFVMSDEDLKKAYTEYFERYLKK